jgi:hypothetical protein
MMRYARFVVAVAGLMLALWACSGSGTSSDGGFTVGTACTRTADCSPGLVCYRTEKPDGEAGPRNYLPDGYCTKNCAKDDDCGGDPCLQGYCMKGCSDDSQCERQGYKCWDGKACVANFDIGGACDGTCENGMTCADSTTDEAFGDGYCTFSCENARDCPMWGGANCAAPSGGDDMYCLMACKNDTECRTEDSYGCRMVHIDADLSGDSQDINFCAGADNIGAVCGTGAECSEGLDCWGTADTLFNDKICSRACDKDTSCPANAVCTADADGFCARKCYRDEHCGTACPDESRDLCKNACRYVRTDPQTNDDEMYCSGVNNLGAACEGNPDCTTGLTCLAEAMYPGGFCTRACVNDDDCKPYGADFCVDGQCQRTCQDTDGRGWDFICARRFYTCHKPDPDKGYFCSGFDNYGAACKDNAECSTGLACREGNAFPNGYCTKECQSDSECSGGGFAHCHNGFCARSCEESADCGRYGYVCLDGGGGKKYCSIPPNIGAECEDYEDIWKTDCSEGLDCENGENWPDGYCTLACSSGKDEDCPQGSSSACIERMCMRTCGSDDDCWRSRYSCRGKSKKVDDVNTEYLVCLGIPNVGGACTKDDDCTQSETLQLACPEKDSDWAGQFCTMACANNSECPEQSVCADASSGSGTCVRTCSLDAECGRKRYFCLSGVGDMLCSSNPNVGQTCEKKDDCFSGMDCYDFGNDTKACSKDCKTDNDCFPESSGKCVGDSDGGVADAGSDAGGDAGTADAGAADGGTTDAGDDAATGDAGSDAGTADAGTDAGPPDAGLLPARHCVRECTRDSDCGRPNEFRCDTVLGACKLKE